MNGPAPAFTGNLVLKTRVAVLIRNLEEVQRALGTVRQRRSDLGNLLRFPDVVEKSTADFRRWLELTIKAYNDDSRGAARTGLEQLGQVLVALENGVNATTDPLSRLQPSPFLEEELAKTEAVAKAVHESLEKVLRTRFGEKFENLTALRSTVQSAGVAAEVQAEAARELQDAWAKYTDELYESSETLFAEYVDLVGGIAIRDTGFDRGICRIAEDLLKPVRTIGNFTWNNLTIPTRREALSVTAARVVRLGFPEWSIWTLPLTAHELGNDYVDGDREVAAYVEERLDDREQILVCMADAFATYFMGPAYACPAILMRLNPAAALADDGLVAKRAAVILTVLTRMSRAERPLENLYGPITARLGGEWGAALQQTLARSDGVPDAEEPADAAAPEGADWLSPGDAAAIARWTWLSHAELQRVIGWVQKLEPLVWSRRLDLGTWPTIEQWADTLKSGGDVDADELRRYEVRYLLNATWRARIAVADDERDIDDVDELHRIVETGEKHLWALLDPSVRHDAQGEHVGAPRQLVIPVPAPSTAARRAATATNPYRR